MPSLIQERSVGTPEMIQVFSDEALVRAALAFEAALAEATAAEGLISTGEAESIEEACRALPDIVELAESSAHAGSMAIALIAGLRERIAATDPRAAQTLHMGATSQDVLDTALMLQTKSAVALVERDLHPMLGCLALLAERHAGTPMLGRTLLQSARPITFGLKVSQWLVGLHSAAKRLRREATGALTLQLGGPVGTRAGLAGKGPAIAARMAAALGLADPQLPWHTRRDGIAGTAAALGILNGTVAKIARDVSLMAQNELSETLEPRMPGRGGSSSMPHKRNPTGCQIALSAQIRAPGLVSSMLSAMPHEHERALGGWQAEAPVLAELFLLTHGSIVAMANAIEGLEVQTTVMQSNLAAAQVGQDSGEAIALVTLALKNFRMDR